MKLSGPKAAPAYQTYAADELADSRYAAMSLEAKGVLSMLKNYAWIDGSVPADPHAVARLVHAAPDVVDRLWPEIVVMFDERDGRLIYPPHEEQRVKHAAHREKSRLAGVASGEARRSKSGSRLVEPEANGGSTDVEPKPNIPYSDLRTPTSVLQSDKTRAREAVEPDALMSAFRAGWKKLYGYECSLILKGNDQTLLLQQCKAVERDQLREALKAYFASSDEFIVKAKHPLGLFLRDPLKFLAKPVASATAPASIYRCYDHEPPCKDLAEHTTKNRAARLTIPDDQQPVKVSA